MKKLMWIGAAVAGLLTATAAGACDEEHQTAQQEQKPQKKVAAKKAAKKSAAKQTLAQNEKK